VEKKKYDQFSKYPHTLIQERQSSTNGSGIANYLYKTDKTQNIDPVERLPTK
jgi:hypothetical protein